MSETDLIHQCQSGDLNHFSELYALYIDKIYRFCYLKTSHQQTAEDITSTVFTKALEKIESFDPAGTGAFQAWLYKIAYNSIIDYYRSDSQSPSLEQIQEYHFYKSQDYAGSIDNKDTLKSVRNFLDTLPTVHAEIVLLRVWEDLGYDEISRITGKTVDNCKQILSRSLKKIQANITSLLLILIIL